MTLRWLSVAPGGAVHTVTPGPVIRSLTVFTDGLFGLVSLFCLHGLFITSLLASDDGMSGLESLSPPPGLIMALKASDDEMFGLFSLHTVTENFSKQQSASAGRTETGLS